mgnify:CR=1 FL=1
MYRKSHDVVIASLDVFYSYGSYPFLYAVGSGFVKRSVASHIEIDNKGTVLGKPHSEENAHEMLRELSGHTHEVVTGVTISTIKKHVTLSACTSLGADPFDLGRILFYGRGRSVVVRTSVVLCKVDVPEVPWHSSNHRRRRKLSG